MHFSHFELFNLQVVNLSKKGVESKLFIVKIVFRTAILKEQNCFDKLFATLFEFLKVNRHFMDKILEISAKQLSNDKCFLLDKAPQVMQNIST